MAMTGEATIVMTTVDSDDLARSLAARLLEQQLAACVQEIRINSRYRWEGELKCEAEILLLVKTSAQATDGVIRLIEKHHSYDVPEILAIPVSVGLPAYLGWLADETAGAGRASQ